MKLFHSPTSPFVRKVTVCAAARGIRGRLELVDTNPWTSPPALLAQNPLSKVPCLVTEDGLALFDSPVICEYLDSVGDEAPMFPVQHTARWRALKWQAIGDGMMDAAVIARNEAARPREDARDAVIARQKQAVTRGLDVGEAAPPPKHLDIGTVTVACALGYLDLRFADMNWREGRPLLAQWEAEMAAMPELKDTAPP